MAAATAALWVYDSRMLQNAPRYAIERGAAAAPVPAPSPDASHECYRCQETARDPTRPFVWEGGRREPWYLCELPGFCYKGVADAVARGWDPDLCAGWDGLAFFQLAKWLVFETDGTRYAAWIDPIRILSITEAKGLAGQDRAWVRRAAHDYNVTHDALARRGGAPLVVDFVAPWRLL